MKTVFLAILLVLALAGLGLFLAGAQEDGALLPDVERGAVSIRTVHGEPARELQRKLQQESLYWGAIHGVVDDETICALKEYQRRNDLRVTGGIDPATAASLGIDPEDLFVPGGEPDEAGPPPEAVQRDPRRGDAPMNVPPLNPTQIDPRIRPGTRPTEGSSMPTATGDARQPVDTDWVTRPGDRPPAVMAASEDELPCP